MIRKSKTISYLTCILGNTFSNTQNNTITNSVFKESYIYLQPYYVCLLVVTEMILMKCNHCKSNNTFKNGKAYSGGNLIQKWMCKDCKKSSNGKVVQELKPVE